MARSKKPSSKDKANVAEREVAPTLTKYQSFTPLRILRSQIQAASYNPRRALTDNERRKLRALLKKHGLFNAVVWNQRSGNLVAGHQRLKILDALEGGADFLIDVDAVDVDAKQEREMCIAHNNANAQGDYDIEKLGELIKESELDSEAMGFDPSDLYRLFGDMSATVIPETEMGEVIEKLQEAREQYDKQVAGNKRDSHDFYTVIIWRDGDHLAEAHKLLGFDDNRFQSGITLLEKLGLNTDEESND